MKPVFYVYSKKGCHLCEILIEQLLELIKDQAEIHIEDIENSNTLMERYHLRIPVVKYKNQTLFQYHFNSSVIKKILKSSSGE